MNQQLDLLASSTLLEAVQAPTLFPTETALFFTAISALSTSGPQAERRTVTE